MICNVQSIPDCRQIHRNIHESTRCCDSDGRNPKEMNKTANSMVYLIICLEFQKKTSTRGTNTAFLHHLRVCANFDTLTKNYRTPLVKLVWEDEPYFVLFPCKIWTTKELFPLSNHDHCASMRQKPPSPSTTLSLLLGFG